MKAEEIRQGKRACDEKEAQQRENIEENQNACVRRNDDAPQNDDTVLQNDACKTDETANDGCRVAVLGGGVVEGQMCSSKNIASLN